MKLVLTSVKRTGICNLQIYFPHHNYTMHFPFGWDTILTALLICQEKISQHYLFFASALIFLRVIYQQKTMTKSYCLCQKALKNLVYCDVGYSKMLLLLEVFDLQCVFFCHFIKCVMSVYISSFSISLLLSVSFSKMLSCIVQLMSRTVDRK